MEVVDVDELTLATASEFLDRRDLSARELLDATLQRLDETEPRVGAYRCVMRDEAMDAARRADEELAGRGQWRGPLHGVPVAVKDLCYTVDASTEAGSEVLKGFRSTYDATVVQRLRAGGAIIVGKTTTTEFGYTGGTETRNPWDPKRSASGSSVGSAVSVAVRSCLGAVGTDGGGSIRSPAAANGVVGIKPTWGLVSRHGVLGSDSLSQVGSIARTVTDCALVLGLLAGPDIFDPETTHAPVIDYCSGIRQDVRGLRLGVERNFLNDSSTSDLARSAVNDVLRAFRELGVTVVDVELEDFDLILAVFFAVYACETAAKHREMLKEMKAKYGSALRQLIQMGQLVPVADYVVALQLRRRLRDAVHRIFERHNLDSMLVPGCAPAPILSDRAFDLFDLDVRSSLANLTGLPAISVPAGFSADGAPLAFELYGSPFGESVLFQMARAYEALNSWYRRVPPAAKGS